MEYTGCFKVVKKLSFLRRKLIEWNKICFGQQEQKLQLAQRKLSELNKRKGDLDWKEEDVIEFRRLAREVRETKSTVEAIWKQKSRIEWVRMGDNNTKLFHLVANLRNQRNIFKKL